MLNFNTDQTLQAALQLQESGKFEQAEHLYNQLLTRDPNHADALHFYGLLAIQTNRLSLAHDLLNKAIALDPQNALYQCNRANLFEREGKLEGAVQGFLAALALKPDFTAASANLCIVLTRLGRYAEAIDHLERTLAANPTSPEAHFNLAAARHQAGKLNEAIAGYRRSLELKPDYPDALANFGLALHQSASASPAPARSAVLRQAAEALLRAVSLRPDHIDALLNLGNIQVDEGRPEAAVATYLNVVALRPAMASAHYNLANALVALRRPDEAVAAYRRAIELQPDFADAQFNLGNSHLAAGRLEDAIGLYQSLLARQPDDIKAHANLGMAWRDKGLLDHAQESYQRALSLKPDFAEVHNNLGTVLAAKGRIPDALVSHQYAVATQPNLPSVHSSLLYTLHFSPTSSPQTILDAHRLWNQRHAARFSVGVLPHVNRRQPDRPLRIGYVSPDFRMHPIGRFMLPLLAAHSRDAVETFCYADVLQPDDMTLLLQKHAGIWRNTTGMDDEALAGLIRRDQIDILVDLSMHMLGGRLLVFARRPAPIQVTYLAYASTTGLDAINYRLTDPHLDPPESQDDHYTEKSVRLPTTYWCYQPIIHTPAVNPLPVLTAGIITFGCLNNFSKVTPEMLLTWAALLRSVPDAKLILHALDGDHRQATLNLFSQNGVDPARISFVGMQPLAEYFELYQHIDIALDTAPYGGGTTTCDALYMGVPVVSLVGNTAVGRSGLSILSNIGLPHLVARTPDEYIQIAANLARDTTSLFTLRASLRNIMQASPLMDAPRFARDIESAFRHMWHRWCTN